MQRKGSVFESQREPSRSAAECQGLIEMKTQRSAGLMSHSLEHDIEKQVKLSSFCLSCHVLNQMQLVLVACPFAFYDHCRKKSGKVYGYEPKPHDILGHMEQAVR